MIASSVQYINAVHRNDPNNVVTRVDAGGDAGEGKGEDELTRIMEWKKIGEL